MIDQQLIAKARATNLAEYLISVGFALKKKGRSYVLVDHDSCVITGNKYYWNSRNDFGNTVSFLVKYCNMDFKTAVSTLTNTNADEKWMQKPRESRNFTMPQLAENYSRIFAYLGKNRKINYELLNYLVNNKLLMQEERTNNAIFPFYDECDDWVGAELHGTLSQKRFKGVAEGSYYGYSFNIGFPANSSVKKDSSSYKYAIFFESAIDLLSFIDIKRNYERKTLSGCLLVSMCGLKKSVFEHIMIMYEDEVTPVIAIDHDEAGKNFISDIKLPHQTIIPPIGKDWNEYLQHLVHEK